MKFKATISEVGVFTKLVASLNLLGTITWMRLDNDSIRFTVIPEQGSQVWAVLPVSAIFTDDYAIQSNSENNVINLEVPLAALHRALRSAKDSSLASLRLTKKDNIPLLCLTISTSIQVTSTARASSDFASDGAGGGFWEGAGGGPSSSILAKDTTISQDVPIRVLAAQSVAGIHEPRCKEPEVHILLPPLAQIKTVSERFTRIALAAGKMQARSAGLQAGSSGAGPLGPKLRVRANMHGELSVGIKTDALSVESRWKGLLNPELDPEVVEGGASGVKDHPSTRWRDLQGEESWATVRVEARDWGRVLGVGRLGGRVVACFCDDHALILYVYLPCENGDDNESVLTYYIGSYAE